MNWFQKFMIGRYGMDQLSNAMFVLCILLLIVGALTGLEIFNLLGFLVIILSYARILSKNINKRRQENMRFLKWWFPKSLQLKQLINRTKGRKTYSYFKCSKCGQRLRVPKGKGKVRIICPKCKNEFTKNT